MITVSVHHQVTILKEFCQGPNQMMYSLPAGSFDEQRHKDYAGCAQAELWEEVSHLCNLTKFICALTAKHLNWLDAC